MAIVMLEKIKKLWKRLGRKKFKIERESVYPIPLSNNRPQTRRGNFTIISENTISAANELVIQPGEFLVLAETIPKQCPLCRTENKVTRLPTNQWQCDECKHTWE
jgi:hypothetical protein